MRRAALSFVYHLSSEISFEVTIERRFTATDVVKHQIQAIRAFSSLIGCFSRARDEVE